MSRQLYRAVLHCPIIEEFVSSFTEVTGILLQFLPFEADTEEILAALRRNQFLEIVMRCRRGAVAFLEPIPRLVAKTLQSRHPEAVEGVCGLFHAGFPLLTVGFEPGLLLAGPVTRKRPGDDCESLVAKLVSWDSKIDRPQLFSTYRAIPVVPTLEPAIHFLSLLTDQLAKSAHRWLLSQNFSEPPCVALAKAYIHQHALLPISLQQVARHVGFSQDHFGRTFRDCTQMTFKEFVSRVRVEKAKEELLDAHSRVMEAAFNSGFQSIAQFNRVFKKYAGLSPSAYRALQGREFAPKLATRFQEKPKCAVKRGE